jgi:hypothetical protein
MATTWKQDEEFWKAMHEDSGLLAKAVEWIRGNLEPEDVFEERELESWAESNGYEKRDED